jgi:hypothetical protein
LVFELERLLTEHLYKNNSEQQNGAFSSPLGTFTILELENLYKINQKKGKCGVEKHEFYDCEGKLLVEFPIYCDNRSCIICKDHKQYQFRKNHQKQVNALKKSIINPKAWVYTGYRINLREYSVKELRKFCQKKLRYLYSLLVRFSASEFSVHMEIKLNSDDTAYIHFHGVSGYIRKLRLVQKLWSRVIRNECAKSLDNVSFYVSKYASKVPVYYNGFQENYYTLLVYKMHMNRFSPKVNENIVDETYNRIKKIEKNEFINPNVKEIWIRNLRFKKRIEKGKKPPPRYYKVDNLKREVYYTYKKSEFNRDGSKNYHPFIDSFEASVNKKKNKNSKLEVEFFE